MGSYEKAMPHYKQALAMRQTLGSAGMATAVEAEALAFVKAQPRTRDGSFPSRRTCPNRRIPLTGGLDQQVGNHARVGSNATRPPASSHRARAKLDDLKGLRRRIDQLLQDRQSRPRARQAPRHSSEHATGWNVIWQRRFRMLQRAKESTAHGTDALAPLLPEHSALIDIVRCTRFEL